MKSAVEQGHIQGLTVNGSIAGLDVNGGGGGGVINVRAGNVLRIDLQISGSPTPTVSWLKDRTPIQLSNRVRRRSLPMSIGPIPWGHSGPLCHALSLSLSSLSLPLAMSWTSMRRRRATVPLATPGEWA